MGNTPVCTIDASGITKPTFADCLAYLEDRYRSIYGQDVYIDQTTPDGQLLALWAAVLDDCNQQTVDVYNAFSPSTAQGVGLSRVVRINGISRKSASYSTASGYVVGVAGTVIEGGIVVDENGYQWDLPESVTIPSEGMVLVDATCRTIGAISALDGTINRILTPVPGWQEFYSVGNATLGDPVETDAELRIRQAYSAALPATSSITALSAAIASITGVTRFRVYENNLAGPDALGIPGRSIAVVVDGGSEQTIVDTISLKKGQGVGTHGTLLSEATPDRYGVSRQIRFSRPIAHGVTYRLRVKPLKGFTTDIQSRIAKSLSDWTNDLGIGQPVLISDAHYAARLMGSEDAKTFRIVPDTFMIASGSGAPAVQDVFCAFNEAPFCLPEYVRITLESA